MKRPLVMQPAILFSILAAAGFVVPSPGANDVANEGRAPGTAALRAYLDPETGELVVGPAPSSEGELDADTQNALRRDDEGLVVQHHADGSVSMDLQGRYQSVSVIQINHDGTASITCTDHAKLLGQPSKDKTAAPNASEVK